MKMDRGETTTQVLLAVPVVFSLLLLAVQSAVYFHTANVASVAAAQGAAAAAADFVGCSPHRLCAFTVVPVRQKAFA